jgi:hypothetical protein
MAPNERPGDHGNITLDRDDIHAWGVATGAIIIGSSGAS